MKYKYVLICLLIIGSLAFIFYISNKQVLTCVKKNNNTINQVKFTFFNDKLKSKSEEFTFNKDSHTDYYEYYKELESLYKSQGWDINYDESESLTKITLYGDDDIIEIKNNEYTYDYYRETYSLSGYECE